MTEYFSDVVCVINVKFDTQQVALWYGENIGNFENFRMDDLDGVIKKIKYCGRDEITVFPFKVKDKEKFLKYINNICTKCGYKIADVKTHHTEFGKFKSDDITCKLVKIKSEPVRKTVSKLSRSKMQKILR